jgi:hypothetical protein
MFQRLSANPSASSSESPELRIHQILEDGIQGEVHRICERLELKHNLPPVIGTHLTLEALKSTLSQTVKQGLRECLSEYHPYNVSVREEKDQYKPGGPKPQTYEDSTLAAICCPTQQKVSFQPGHSAKSVLNLTKRRILLFERRYKLFFGTVTFKSYSEVYVDPKTKVISHSSASRLDLGFSFLPDPRFFSTAPVLAFSAHRSDSNYQIHFSLIYFNVRPNDTEVFNVCRTLNLPLLKELFRTRQASLLDVDEKGRSLLQVGLEYTPIAVDG